MRSMKKRLTEAQFLATIKGLEIGQQTIDIARGVLVEGRPQAEFVAALGVTKGAVSQAVSRVWVASQGNLPEGFTSPTRTEAKAFPDSVPLYHDCIIAGTSFTQGIAIALPEILTTTRFLFALSNSVITLS